MKNLFIKIPDIQNQADLFNHSIRMIKKFDDVNKQLAYIEDAKQHAKQFIDLVESYES
jgi:hypothetical protein